jgi:hypothetical protein
MVMQKIPLPCTKAVAKWVATIENACKTVFLIKYQKLCSKNLFKSHMMKINAYEHNAGN